MRPEVSGQARPPGWSRALRSLANHDGRMVDDMYRSIAIDVQIEAVPLSERLFGVGRLAYSDAAGRQSCVVSHSDVGPHIPVDVDEAVGSACIVVRPPARRGHSEYLFDRRGALYCLPVNWLSDVR